MSTTLYRKYRPHTFEDVVGQEHVVAALRGMIEKKHIGHAFIFAGGRGIGKTTIARIFAKEVGVQENDLYEIDAASFTGVDTIRELRDGVGSLPFSSPYKAYILDEAHMLSKAAFNALLKTLEEPPAHAIFMLATTDLDKIPDTVQSRCEIYVLEEPQKDVLASVLTTVAKKEGYTLRNEDAQLLAEVGDGSFRDALSLLQQVLAATHGKEIRDDTVARVTRMPSNVLVFSLLDALVEGSLERALSVVDEARRAHVSMRGIAERVLAVVRAVLVLRLAPSLATHIEQAFSKSEYERITLYAQSKDARPLSFFSAQTLRRVFASLDGVARSSRPDVGVELLCVELCSREV